jgi:hypothetical protein
MKPINKKLRKNKTAFPKGFAALMAVLIIGAVGLVITISLISMGIGTTQATFAIEQSAKAKALADSCVEEALLKIREETFLGSETIFFGSSNCFYEVGNLGVNQRLITSEAVVGTITRRVKVTTDKINNKITITSWEEVSDF